MNMKRIPIKTIKRFRHKAGMIAIFSGDLLCDVIKKNCPIGAA